MTKKDSIVGSTDSKLLF